MNLKKTPLNDAHKNLGAKLVPFAGWEMPVLYSSVINEHNTVREKAGIFDICHMGLLLAEGPEVETALDELSCNKVSGLSNGKALYSAITNDKGGVEDDIIIYKVSSEKFYICVNASNIEKDFEWFSSKTKRNAKFSNLSEENGIIAIQGPRARDIIHKLEGGMSAASLKPFEFFELTLCGIKLIIARTGYTGEDGYELFFPRNKAEILWNSILETGQSDGLIPCGLGARDTLRLEACYPLHGHELSPEISAVQSGLGWIVKSDKADYPGKSILLNELKNGAENSLTGFYVEDNGIVREQSKVFNGAGQEIGFVTSGTKTPTINRALGLAIIKSDFSPEGTKIKIQVRDKFLNCTVVKKPFYKRGK